MSEAIIIAIIISIAPTLLALLNLLKLKKTSLAIKEVHLSINSRMDELLKSSKAESKAEGLEQGRSESK